LPLEIKSFSLEFVMFSLSMSYKLSKWELYLNTDGQQFNSIHKNDQTPLEAIQRIPSLHNLSIARVMFRFGRVFLHIVCTEVFWILCFNLFSTTNFLIHIFFFILNTDFDWFRQCCEHDCINNSLFEESKKILPPFSYY
jgi:hypothetical protein